MKNFLIIMILFSIVFSCRKEIDIDVPNSERKIVLNAVVLTDSVFSANVFRSNHIQDISSELLYLNNAVVNIYENDELIETLELVDDGYYRGKTKIAQAEHEYTIEAKVPGLQKVKATTKTLSPIKILSIDSLGIHSDNDEFGYYDEEFDEYVTYSSYRTVYNLKFKDDANADNYYRFRIVGQSFEPYDSTFWDPGIQDSLTYTVYPPYVSSDSDDPSIEVWSYFDEYFYVSDNLFNGKEYNMEFYTYPIYDVKGMYVKVYFEHISKEFYHYMKSIDFQDETLGAELFFQTVQVYNNIENGFGIIGSASASVDSFYVYGNYSYNNDLKWK